PDGEAARWQATQQQLNHLRTSLSRWPTVLADLVADLMSDVEFDLRDRSRAILREVERYFEQADPKRDWAEFEDWLRDSLTEVAEVNFGWLVDRFEWIAMKIAS